MPKLVQVNVKYWRYYSDDELPDIEHPIAGEGTPGHLPSRPAVRPPGRPSQPDVGGTPEHPIYEPTWEDRIREALEVAKAKLEDLRQALEDNKDEVLGSIKGKVESVAAAIKAKIDEIKSATPEHPIVPPGRREEIEAKIKQAVDYVKEHGSEKIAAIKAKAQSLINQAIDKINEIRAGLPKPEHPIFEEDLDGAKDRLKQKLDEIKSKIGDRLGTPTHPDIGSPEHPIEPGSSVADRIQAIKNYLDNVVIIIPEHRLLEPVKPVLIRPEVSPH